MSLSRLSKSADEMRKVTEKFNVSSPEELFVGVGYGKVSPRAVTEFLSPPKEGDKPRAARLDQGGAHRVARPQGHGQGHAGHPAERHRRRPRPLHQVL